MEQFGYIISTDPDSGSETITCLTCNKTSYSIDDVKYRYCGYCKKFHDDGKALVMSIFPEKEMKINELVTDFILFGIASSKNIDIISDEYQVQLSELFKPGTMRAMGQLEDEAGQ